MSYISINGEPYTSPYVDLHGKPVEKNPITNPYDFDNYVEWKGNWDEHDSASYSDRMVAWDSGNWNKSYKEVFGTEENKFDVKRPIVVNEFLNLYFDEQVELTAILRGCNHITGFSYYVFYYRTADQPRPEKRLERIGEQIYEYVE